MTWVGETTLFQEPMIEPQNIEYEAQCSLYRILPHVEEILKPQLKKVHLGWEQFFSRWHRNLPRPFTLYADVYRNRYDLFFYLEALVVGIARLWLSLPNTTFQQRSLS